MHQLTQQPPNPRYKKQTVFKNNNNYTYNLDSSAPSVTHDTIKQNLTQIHTHIVQQHTLNEPPNKVLNGPPPEIHADEKSLSHHMRRTLAQLRTNKSPMLYAYLHRISPDTHPTPLCPLCNLEVHNTQHLFSCNRIQTHLTPIDLWSKPAEVGALVARWHGGLGALPELA